jgi:hypothetical protein
MMKDNGLNPSTLAKLMLGEGASKESISNKRSQISKWANPPTNVPGERGGISEENALAIVAAINPMSRRRYPEDFLVKPRVRRTSVDDLAEQVAQYRRETAELRKEVRRLREVS